MDDQQAANIERQLERIAQALEAASPAGKPVSTPEWTKATTWIWDAEASLLRPVMHDVALPLALLIGIGPQMELLTSNTRQFAQGYSANNALLWGARGMGKSSLVKSVHADIAASLPLMLVEIHREDLWSLPRLLSVLRTAPELRFLLFCDDLSFDEHDSSYKSLKAVLEGGLEGRPENVLFYATSNRRHLIPRRMIENEREDAIHPGESVEEKVSLSDRFGLWLGFHACGQQDYLAMIAGYCSTYGLEFSDADAIEWFRTRGHRSGRVAWQFIQHIAGQQKKRLA